MNSDITSLLATIVSLFAVFISYQTFRRNRSLDNENHLYKYKLEKYDIVIEALSSLVAIYQDDIIELHTMYHNGDLTEEEIDEKMDDIDDDTFNLQDKILATITFLPSHIVEQIDNFLSTIFKDNIDSIIRSKNTQKYKDFVVLINGQIGDIQDSMRNDMHIESLDKKLKRRTRE